MHSGNVTENAHVPAAESFKLLLVDQAILWLVSALITGGNAAIIAVFCKAPTLRTVTNCFVVSLAVSDFLSGAALLPCLLILGLDHPAVQPAIMFIFVAALGNICTCSYDRHLAVTKALLYEAIMDKKLLRKLLITVWCTAAILAALPNICGPKVQSNLFFRQIFLGIVISVMLAVIMALLVTYLRIFIIARRHVRFIKSQSNYRGPTKVEAPSTSTVSNGDSACSRGSCKKRTWVDKSKISLRHVIVEVRFVKLFALIVLAFALCWFPFVYINLVADVMLLPKWAPAMLLRVSLHTIFISSLLNPIIYGYYQKTFRSALLTIVRWSSIRGSSGKSGSRATFTRGERACRSALLHMRLKPRNKKHAKTSSDFPRKFSPRNLPAKMTRKALPKTESSSAM